MPQTALLISIQPCSPEDFPEVEKNIALFCLDDIQPSLSQFITAKNKNNVVGFARTRNYRSCNELCSLGVKEDLRLKGIGSKLVTEIIKQNAGPLFVVTIIPEFFKKFGFNEVSSYPEELNYKLEYCETSLSVPEPYVVMQLK